MQSWNWLKLTLPSPQKRCGQSSHLTQSCRRCQNPDGHLLPRPVKALDRGEQAPGSGGDAGSGGDVGPEGAFDDGPADGVLDEYGNVVPFWGDEPEGVPALHAMRAGGEQAGQARFSASFSTTSSTWPGSNNQVSCATMPTCSWEEAEAVHEEELQEHWALKTLWMNELRHVAIGGDESREQGQWLELLMEEVLRREKDLEQQHEVLERHRLASLVQNSMEVYQGHRCLENKTPETSVSQAAGDPPSTVLQTYTVPLQQVRKEVELWKQPLLGEYKSLTEITGVLKVTTEKELQKDPRYDQMEVAPAMLVSWKTSGPDSHLWQSHRSEYAAG